MINDLIMSLVAMFIIEPFEAEMKQSLQGAQAPAAVMRQVSGCLAAAPGALAREASGDWGWAIGAALKVAVGAETVETVVAGAVPQCATALAAAKPFLSGSAGEG